MSREEALKKLEGTWLFKEVNGAIALREVALIEAVAEFESERVQQQHVVPQSPTPNPWPAL